MRALRLPNKTQWALQDINLRSKEAQRDWARAVRVAERNIDPHLALLLARMRDHLSFMERTAILALQGEYEQPPDETKERVA